MKVLEHMKIKPRIQTVMRGIALALALWACTGIAMIMFEEPAHGALTYHLAIAAGFTDEQATTIALACAGVDHDSRTKPTNVVNIYSYKTEYWHFDIKAPERLVRHIKNGVPDLVRFGQDLHTVMDVGYKDAPGPHVRGMPIYVPVAIIPTRAGHPINTNEDGSPSHPFSTNADHAHRNPQANKALFDRLFLDLIEAARAKNGPAVQVNHAAANMAIQKLLGAKSNEDVRKFLDEIPAGASKSYSTIVRENRGKVRWTVDEIDTSVP